MTSALTIKMDDHDKLIELMVELRHRADLGMCSFEVDRIPTRVDQRGRMPGGEDATMHEWDTGHAWYGTETECWTCE